MTLKSKIHQNIEQIINASTAAQRIVWEQILLLVGDNATIQPLWFDSSLGGSELLTYVAGKVYFAYRLLLSSDTTQFTTAPATILYDENNSTKLFLQNFNVGWDVTAVGFRFYTNNVNIENIFFSRLTSSHYYYCSFMGFKIIYL